ncbi:MAG: helix-turn-helix transcriptional regulator [Clostridia bacterium]|nr:helix-turn-helix transcriptional regulator [Clostridia bacterium]
MTQARLANMLHVTPQAVSKWERGEAVPDIQMVLLIAMKLGVSMDDLMFKDLV